MGTSLPDCSRAVADRAIALTGADWGGVRWGGFRGAPYTAKRESGDDHEMRVVAA